MCSASNDSSCLIGVGRRRSGAGKQMPSGRAPEKKALALPSGSATAPCGDDGGRGGKNDRMPLLTGVHHVSVPTSDPLAGSDWYVRVFGFATLLIEERESEVVAVLLQHPCGARLLLRHAGAPLAALRGYPLFGLTVASHTELLRWVEHLTTFDVEHSAVHQAHLGWAVTVTGPDQVRIQLHTDEGPSGEDD